MTVAADDPPLGQTQFKATHNSYRLADPPQVQIDTYDVWEIELDFGLSYDSDDFLVGHDYPEARHNLISLGDWVRNCLKAKALTNHPLILKLEAKTHKPCGRLRVPAFTCVEDWDKNWQTRLTDSLRSWLGDDWITPAIFAREFDSLWPTVSYLAGKVIVTLQDSQDDTVIDLDDSRYFPREIPGLTALWPPLDSQAEFDSAVVMGVNRVTMDGAYRQPWTKMTPGSDTD